MSDLSDNLKRLRSAVERIRNAGEDAQRLDEIQHLVSRIRTAFDTQYELDLAPVVSRTVAMLRAGLPTPSLTVCGRGTREVRFTKYLAYFLKPDALHGLGDSVLEVFVGLIAARCSHIPADWRSAFKQVDTELNLGTAQTVHGERRCQLDLAIQGTTYSILVENKILAGETPSSGTQQAQLVDYDSVLASSPRWTNRSLARVLLAPRERTLSSSAWMMLTYDELVGAMCPLLEDEELPRVARQNLCRFLMDAALGPGDSDLSELRRLRRLGEELLASERPSPRSISKFSSLRERLTVPLRILEASHEG